MDYHLAQVNIGRMKVVQGTPEAAGFFDELDRINELADSDPGFVWRLQTDEGNATSLRVMGEANMLINLSVWKSIDALKTYTYRSDHTQILRQRRDWFERMEEPHLALWWVPAGHIPSVVEAEDKIQQLRAEGPSQGVFTFAKPFPPPQ